MGLIEADKLLKQLEWLDTDDFILYEEVKKDIDEMPTVKAIPIEWINNWLSKGRNAKYFIPMMKMVEEWEKENDKGSE